MEMMYNTKLLVSEVITIDNVHKHQYNAECRLEEREPPKCSEETLGERKGCMSP